MEKTLKSYEISFLLKSEVDAAVLVKKLSDLGAEISKEGPIEHINLAYPIKRETSAYFGYMNFNAEPGVVKSINDALELETKILRFLIITPPIEKMVPRRNDYYRQAEQTTEAAKAKVEPLSNAELEEKLEEILK
ncbi:MAG: 30S ribosomal protein S6 [Patescibacteria group bacterium]|nr:30S ribosomal protein S6 [Patescibacteria group bacterium]MCL5224366.1 30S ribosomal protein S6 [Patescibacteria group bacterium]